MAHAVGDYAAEPFLKLYQIVLKKTPWLRQYTHKANEVAMFWLQYRTLSVSILVALKLGDRIPQSFAKVFAKSFVRLWATLQKGFFSVSQLVS